MCVFGKFDIGEDHTTTAINKSTGRARYRGSLAQIRSLATSAWI
jgi:hypothetical protein